MTNQQKNANRELVPEHPATSVSMTLLDINWLEDNCPLVLIYEFYVGCVFNRKLKLNYFVNLCHCPDSVCTTPPIVKPRRAGEVNQGRLRDCLPALLGEGRLGAWLATWWREQGPARKDVVLGIWGRVADEGHFQIAWLSDTD